MEVNDAQQLKKSVPRLVTLLNPAKSMEVNAVQCDTKPDPSTSVTLLNPAKSTEVNPVQRDKKLCPRVVTLPNPAKLIEVNDVHSYKK